MGSPASAIACCQPSMRQLDRLYSSDPAIKPIRRWPSAIKCSVAMARRTFVVHRHRDAGAGLNRTNPRKRNFSSVQKAGDQRIFGMRRCQYDAVGLQRGNRRTQFAFDMVIMRVDQFEDHPIAMFGAFQHAAQQHLVDPVSALPGLPVGNGPFAVIDGKDQIGLVNRSSAAPRSRAHSPACRSTPAPAPSSQARTLGSLLMTRLTVCRETPASAATCLIVTAWRRLAMF